MTLDHAIARLQDIASRRDPDVEALALARMHGRVLARPWVVAGGGSPGPAGVVMTPLRVALAAESGVATVEVARRPTVAVFAIGDAVEPGLPLNGGGRHDGARDLLVGLLRADGLEPTAWPRLPADPRQVEIALRDAGCAFDAIVVCGDGGALEQVRCVLESFGSLDSAREAPVAPEREAVFGTIDRACVLALPADPIELTGFHLTLGRCLVDGLEGRREDRPRWRGRMAAAASDARFQLVRTRFGDDGVLRVFPLAPTAGAAARDADALLVLPDAAAPPGIDTPVDVIPLPRP
jgi:molybdopterin molybdotransferase